MSTVLLMTDTWHPTVLRIVPFSNNNAKGVLNNREMLRSPKSSRGFPVLAVTRPGNNRKSANSLSRSESSRSSRSAASPRSENRENCSDYSESVAHGSEYTNDPGDETILRKGSAKKYAKKRVPEMHSEMKEAIKFTVQDLNDQVSSTSSMHSAESAVEQRSKDKKNKIDNTRTKLPKPSLSTVSDTRFYAPINGVRRSVPLTPGEMELKKFKENYMTEQSQKRTKYKLNVNQLPRSTTPINDHDPDKLNMKQVIAFLQTKTPKEVQKKNDLNSRAYKTPRAGASPIVNIPQRRVPSRNTDSSMSRPDSELKYVDKTDNTRLDNPGCVSVLSTKSTPNLPYGSNTLKSPRKSSTMSVKSYGDRASDKRSSKQKPVKEFKLYRFLAIAPDGKSAGLATTVSDGVSSVNDHASLLSIRNNRAQYNNPPSSPRRFLRRKSRDSTANILHRHVIKRNGSSPVTDSKEADEQNKSIRLPSMADTGRESPDEEDSCSTTSATCNSTKNSSTKDDRSKLPKKAKCITFSEETKEVPVEKVKIVEEDYNNNDVFEDSVEYPIRSYIAPEFPRVNINGPRQIHVSMPQENNAEKGYSQEIVRLTLRQDKNATRVTSYMSDIQTNALWHEQEKNAMNDGLKSLPSAANTGHLLNHDSKEWMESSRQLISNFSNNNFIKVRQKLKTTNLLNVEK